MLYKFRFDKFKWCGAIPDKSPGDLFVAFYLEFPQYGKSIIATNGDLCKFDDEDIYIFKDREANNWDKV